MREPRAVRLAVIPARGGSRRLPGKNIRPFAGRPMLAWTVEAALASGLFGRVVVTTDSEEIAQVAREAGADVPFLRDPGLADDHTPVSAATVDALRRVGDPRVTEVAQLMPNCPLRTAGDIVASQASFAASGAGAQLSVTGFGWCNPWWASRLDAGGRMQPVFDAGITARGQDLEPLYCTTGAVWWARAEVLASQGTFHVPDRTGWPMPWARAIDIDTQDDWELAEALVAAHPGASVGHAG